MTSAKTIKIYTEQDSFFPQPYADFDIRSYRDEEPEALNRIEPHRHSYYEIIWVKSGEGIHSIDFADYQFSGPCLFLLHPQHIHTIQKKTPTVGGVVKFSLTTVSENEGKADLMLLYGVFDDIDVLPVINLTAIQSGEISKLFDDLYCAYQDQSVFSGEILRCYLRIFLLKIYSIKKNALPVSASKSRNLLRFREFQHLLENNFSLHHSPAFYAAHLNITGKTLNNLTQSCCGISPSQLIKQRILLEARRLLHHERLSVKEIASGLGFADAAYFTRFFKENTQSSPRQYQKAGKKGGLPKNPV